MKKFNFYLALLGVVLLASCQSEIDCPDNPLSLANQVTFNSTIGEMAGTRAAGTQWGQGDAIGVYALNAGQALSDQAIFDSKANVKHTTTGDGVFTAASTQITFPETGNLDFVAYYPFQNSISNYTYPINVSTQSDPAAIDVLYSNNAKNAAKGNVPVSLVFGHQLSQLIFNISAGDNIASLTGLTAKIENLKTDGSMNLATGVVTAGSTTTAINPVVTVSEKNATVVSILVPGQDLKSAKITFTLNGKVYEWMPTESQSLASGKKYTYLLKLSSAALTTVEPKGTITDWGEGYTGTTDIVLTPNEDPQFTADKTTASLPATGTLTDVVKLTTQNDQAWTAASSEGWVTVSPANGTGSGDITLTAQENTTTAERTATVTVTPSGSTSLSPITVTVTQAAGGTTTPDAEPVVFYSETFDNVTTEKVKFNAEGTSVSGFDFSTGKYTGSGADVRSTSTMGKHVWFPAYNASYDPAWLEVSNISAGYKNIKLTYDLAANGTGIPVNGLMIKCNDTDVALPTENLGGQNEYKTITIDITVEDITTLKFYTDDSNSKGYRIDNVKLEGVKK